MKLHSVIVAGPFKSMQPLNTSLFIKVKFSASNLFVLVLYLNNASYLELLFAIFPINVDDLITIDCVENNVAVLL